MRQGQVMPRPKPKGETQYEIHFKITGVLVSKHPLIRSTYDECRKYIKEYLARYPDECNNIALINTDTMKQVAYAIQ